MDATETTRDVDPAGDGDDDRRGPDSGSDLRLRDLLRAVAANLGLVIDDDGLGRLLAYLALLQRWNRVYNLTAVRDPDEMLSHHLADCLAVVPSIRRHAGGRPLRLLDVGSGAGLPGVVLAVVEREWRVTCVDAVVKKATFVRQVAAELALPNLHAEHARVETMAAGAVFDLVISRAFASLADFTRLTSARLSADGVWVAMKGQLQTDEVDALPDDLEVFHVEPLQVPGLDARRCLVWIRRRRAGGSASAAH